MDPLSVVWGERGVGGGGGGGFKEFLPFSLCGGNEKSPPGPEKNCSAYLLRGEKKLPSSPLKAEMKRKC